MFNKSKELFDDSNVQHGERDGIEIEKGVVLNEAYMEEHFEELGDLFSLFSAYPDLYLDVITPTDSNFQLFFYQRLTLRAIMRYRDVYITAPRAFSKTFITVLGLILQCIFLPGRFQCPFAS